MKDSQKLKSIAWSSGIVLAGIAISKVLNFIYRLIIARTNVEDYGLFNLGYTIFNIATVLALFGLTTGIIRYVSYYKGKKDNKRIQGIFNTSIKVTTVLSILISIALIASSKFIATNIFQEERLAIVIIIMALAIPFNSIRSVASSTIQAFQSIKYDVYGRLITENITKILATIIFLSLGMGILGIVNGFLAGIIVSSLLTIYLLNKHLIKIRTKELKPIYETKKLLSFSAPLILNDVINLLFVWADTLLIGLLLNAKQVGIYNAAIPTAALLFIIPNALITMVTPTISEMSSKKNTKEIKHIYLTTSKWIATANLALLLIFILQGKEIIQLLFGAPYAAAALPLSIIATGAFIHYLFSLSKSILVIHEKTKQIFAIYGSAALFNIILNAILIPKSGITGAAIATAISNTLLGLVLGYASYKLIKKYPLDRTFIKLLLVAVITITLTSGIKILTNNSLINIASIIFIYGVGILLFNIYSKEEKEIAKLMLKKIKGKFNGKD